MSIIMIKYAHYLKIILHMQKWQIFLKGAIALTLH